MPRYKIDSFNEAGMRLRAAETRFRLGDVSPIDVNLRRIKVSSLFISEFLAFSRIDSFAD